MPTRIFDWERHRRPRSIAQLDLIVAETLASLGRLLNCNLLRYAAKSIMYIWVMDRHGSIWIAVEELAELPDGRNLTGHPRRRDFPVHPAGEKKLGHPSLLDGDAARIAGELFLDEVDGSLVWHVNDHSGRYCRDIRPSQQQRANVKSLFSDFFQCEVIFDDAGAPR